tara:strand:- start:413 stop:952 length:540 start_codon:yes stop_codon:yes gene_type:complete
MLTKIICSFIASDRPGLIEMLADTISLSNGSWLESRSTKLAGQFAGIVRIEVSEDDKEQLIRALMHLNKRNVMVQISDSQLTHDYYTGLDTQDNALQLTVLGNDRPGIILHISQALASANINVVDMETFITSAAMSGDSLFNAKLTLCDKNTYDIATLEKQLNSIALRLTLEIDLDTEN